MKMLNLIRPYVFMIMSVMSARDEWQLDKAHSSITFEVQHVVMLNLSNDEFQVRLC